VPEYTRVGKRKCSNSEHATHHQNDEHRSAQKALPSLDRRLDNLFASPFHILSNVFCRTLFGYDRRIATRCTRWWNDRCPSSAHRWSCDSGVNAGWGADDAFRLGKLLSDELPVVSPGVGDAPRWHSGISKGALAGGDGTCDWRNPKMRWRPRRPRQL
jgi:hypothetical protein